MNSIDITYERYLLDYRHHKSIYERKNSKLHFLAISISILFFSIILVLTIEIVNAYIRNHGRVPLLPVIALCTVFLLFIYLTLLYDKKDQKLIDSYRFVNDVLFNNIIDFVSFGVVHDEFSKCHIDILNNTILIEYLDLSVRVKLSLESEFIELIHFSTLINSEITYETDKLSTLDNLLSS